MKLSSRRGATDGVDVGMGSVADAARRAADRLYRPRFRPGWRGLGRFREGDAFAAAAARLAGASAGTRLGFGRGRPPSEAQDLGLSPAAQLVPRWRASRVAPRWRRPRPHRGPGAWP